MKSMRTADARVPAGTNVRAATGRTRVAICIATYQRPVLLRQLLDSLAALEFAPHGGVDLHVIVVDNDADRTAAATVERARAAMPWAVSYLVEPVRNIAGARNRGVTEALAWDANFVAFVDDDERVAGSWLATLLDVQAAYAADVVQGTVLTVLPGSTPEWLRRGSGFDRPRWSTGTRLRYGVTSNALVDARLLARYSPEPFDPAFGLSGGSDTLFFARCRRAGATLIWADEAVVEELISARRASARWVLERAFREGNASVYGERAHPPGSRQLSLQVLRACARVLYGLGNTALTPVGGRARALRGARHFAYAAGTLTALAGYRHYEYARTSGYSLDDGFPEDRREDAAPGYPLNGAAPVRDQCGRTGTGR
jgi:succinoglycan biosynthesis protein ExoM